mgnify:CR=1 FL=1
MSASNVSAAIDHHERLGNVIANDVVEAFGPARHLNPAHTRRAVRAALYARFSAEQFGALDAEKMHEGFASLDEVADAVHAYNPHRPRPTDLSGLRKNVRQRADGRWYWHWDPAFITSRPFEGESRQLRSRPDLLDDAARSLRVPTLLVRGRQSDLLSEQGAREFLDIVPHARYADVGGAGHMVAGDRNDAFNDAVVTFLNDIRGVASP